MAASLLLPAVVPPLAVTLAGWGWCMLSVRRGFLYFLVPITSFLITCFAVVGVPVSPAQNALSWFFYTGLLITTYWLTRQLISPEWVPSWPFNLIALSTLAALIYYPRCTTTTKALTEVAFAGLIIVLGTFYWHAEQARENDRPFVTLIIIGAHFTAGAGFFGVYTSFIVGQVALATGLGVLGTATVLRWFDVSKVARRQKMTTPMILVVSVYCLFYSTLQPVSILVYFLGLSALWLILTERLTLEIWQLVPLVLITVGVFAGCASVIEEYDVLVLSENGKGSYRPYGR